MIIRRHYYLLIALFSLLLNTSNKVHSIYVEKVEVPPMVLAGNTVELQCLYREEGDELYSLKWWRGEDHFYQFIPPKRSFYSIPGVKVNMSATYLVNRLSPPGLEIVVLDTVAFDTAGVFKCEVMADRIFETVSKEANMTVIYPPLGSPMITGSTIDQDTVLNGQRITLMCSSPPANPVARIRWRINNRFVTNSAWVIHHPPPFGGGISGQAQSASSLDFVVSPQLLDESLNGLTIECDIEQPESKYHRKSRVVLFPEKTSNFYNWFFSNGEVHLSTMIAVLGLSTLNELIRSYF